MAFPTTAAVLEACEPVYEELPGWEQPTASVRRFVDLPQEAANYVKRIEELMGCPIDIVSTGPGRDESIVLRSMF